MHLALTVIAARLDWDCTNTKTTDVSPNLMVTSIVIFGPVTEVTSKIDPENVTNCCHGSLHDVVKSIQALKTLRCVNIKQVPGLPLPKIYAGDHLQTGLGASFSW